eukprot:scaffold87818_cov36-Tisochrysis_lutea.AAC.1
MASERNFQLIVGNLNERQPANPPVVLVHGKLEDDVFSLDFTYPLSPLHAFGLTLVTWACHARIPCHTLHLPCGPSLRALLRGSVYDEVSGGRQREPIPMPRWSMVQSYTFSCAIGLSAVSSFFSFVHVSGSWGHVNISFGTVDRAGRGWKAC